VRVSGGVCVYVYYAFARDVWEGKCVSVFCLWDKSKLLPFAFCVGINGISPFVTGDNSLIDRYLYLFLIITLEVFVSAVWRPVFLSWVPALAVSITPAQLGRAQETP
jgi:hypothetical protein